MDDVVEGRVSGLELDADLDYCASSLLRCKNISLVLNLQRYKLKIRNTAVSQANSLKTETQKD